MKKRGAQFKTYGRAKASSCQNNDFDRVFCEGTSTGHSPFGTSDSSNGRSVDLTDFHASYDLRRDFCDSLRDISNESSISQDSMTTPCLKPQKHASRKGNGKKAKKTATRNTSGLRPEKENTFDIDVPDYDAIAEDSFIVETENQVRVTKCSTPLANSIVQASTEGEGPPTFTPILQVPQLTDYLNASEINRSISFHTFSPAEKLRCEYMSTNNVATRRSSRLKTKLITSKKLLIEEDHKIVSLTPNKNLSSQDMSSYDPSMFNVTDDLHEKASISGACDESADDLLKQIGANISNLAAINLSLDSVMVPNTASPLENHFSSPHDVPNTSVPSFDASNDLFHSPVNSHLEGLSYISEEDTAYDDSLHSTRQAHDSQTNSFLSKLSTHSVFEHEQLTAKQKLFSICEQDEFVSYSTCIPTRMMDECVKIGEGVYGEVFRSKSGDKNVAIKIIPMEGSFNVNDCPQKTYEELLPEAVIAKELSDLACGFCQVNRISCVQGDFPAPLLNQWDAYAKRKVSENDRPDIFTKDQLFAVFEFADGGTALEDFQMANHQETLSVLRQVVFALAVAESTLGFEHRDLHIGNILVRQSQETTVKFQLEGEEIEFHSEGVIATIIDFTISRLKKDGCAVFCDISTDDGLFEGSGDIQFDVYRDMKQANQNDWSKFCPHSNILWVQYLCKKLLTVIKVKENGREHRNSLRLLRQLNQKISNYESCYHLALDSQLWNF